MIEIEENERCDPVERPRRDLGHRVWDRDLLNVPGQSANCDDRDGPDLPSMLELTLEIEG
jgi:hypothetical protein